MLHLLSLRNFILAQTLELELSEGFGVLTGETGAGKSILLDALQCVTGARADLGWIRSGSDKAEVVAVFRLAKSSPALALLAEWGIDCEDEQEPELILRRVIDLQSRHKASINGVAVTVSQLSQIGGSLLEIHGQHDSMLLLRPAHQRQLLDQYAAISDTVLILEKHWQTWQNAIEQLAQAEKNQAELLGKRDYLLMQHDDLSSVLSAEEWENLNQRHALLAHRDTLNANALQVLDWLADSENGSLESVFRRVKSTIANMNSLDANLHETQSLILSIDNELQEVERMLRHYVDKMERDPESLQEVENAMQHQMERARKYRIRPEALMSLQQEVSQQLAKMEQGLDLEALAQQVTQAEIQYHELASKISSERQKAAELLAGAICLSLPDLGMKTARMKVACTSIAPSAQGIDHIEFQVSGLAGREFRPLAKVVSGGELSRLALALFVALHSGEQKTYVFDEVDAGIGGAVAEAVGRMLAQLAQQSPGGQILCVTHLAQVAVCANWHGLVEKNQEAQGAVATSKVTVLDHDQARVDEVARMLGGKSITSATLAHAREMLSIHHQPAGYPPHLDCAD